MRFRKIKMKMTNTRLIALSFAAVIFVGTLLLCLPFSSASGTWTNPLNALFTATTSTCVTGLVVYDTSAHWSFFGQVVILSLIQIGGIGSMPGAMLGGVLLGIIETFSKAYISTQFSDAIVFSVLVIILLVKPTGLLGKKVNEKV